MDMRTLLTGTFAEIAFGEIRIILPPDIADCIERRDLLWRWSRYDRSAAQRPRAPGGYRKLSTGIFQQKTATNRQSRSSWLMSRLLRKRISGSGLPARTERRRIGDFGFCAMTGAPPASAFRRRPRWRAKKEARRERRPRSCVNLAQLHRADLTLVVSLITATPNRVIFDGIEKIFGKSQGIQGGFRNVSLGGWRRSAATVISLSLRQLEGYSLGEGDEACAVWHPPLPCRASPPQGGRSAGGTGFPKQWASGAVDRQ